MATKSNKKTNTRVSKKAKGPANHLKIWVGVLVVIIVAVVGILWINLSRASQGTGIYFVVKTLVYNCSPGTCSVYLMRYDQGREAGTLTAWYRRAGFTYGLLTDHVWQVEGTNTCLLPSGSIKNTGYITKTNAYNRVEIVPCP